MDVLPVSETRAPRLTILRVLVQDAGTIAALAILSLGTGWLLNQGRLAPLPLIYQSKHLRLESAVAQAKAKNPPLPLEAASQLREITLDEFQDFVNARQGPIVDARTSEFFRLAHVPGALNVSRENFDADYARERPQLTARHGQPIAIYCSEADCQDSTLVASALADLGYPSILVYREGWAEWSQAGLPQESAR